MLYGIYTLIGTAYLLSLIMFFGYVYMSEFDFNQMPPLSRSLPLILLSMYIVVILVSAYKLLKHNYKSMEQNKALENKFLQTQLQLKEEEFRFLKMQIHPHFLFNTLNTLYGFALKKADEAPEMILKLSNLLDYILYQIDKPKVLLSEEINHIEDYIGLEKMRFHDTLDIQLDNDNTNQDFQVAPMLLIPFVENSFKHGNLINGILTINIKITTTDNMLIFSISNSFTDNENKKDGIGLKNIKKRLEMLYPNQYELIIQTKEQKFDVILKLKINV